MPFYTEIVLLFATAAALGGWLAKRRSARDNIIGSSLYGNAVNAGRLT